MNNRIATLGPVGTDSHRQAERLSSEVGLFETYHAAIEHAKKYKNKLLVPAGFREIHRGSLVSWVDFHFKNIDTFELEAVWYDKTMPMVLLHHSYQRIALHPSTSALVPDLESYTDIIYTRSKVEAYELFKRGNATAAIVSDSSSQDLTDPSIIKNRLTPTMVWCLYRVKESFEDDL